MRAFTFGVALLGATGLCLASDQGEMDMDTWCVTYVSTYLAPVANEPGGKPTAQDSSRVPFNPSIRPTFGKNTSSVVRTSFSETSTLNSEFPTLESQLTNGDTTSQEPTSDAPASDTESVISTSIAPTSSGIVEPEGRSIIFLVSIPDDNNNNKRSFIKRATGGFVGNDNPGSCTFASIFNLADGELFDNGVPIYYSSGEDYKELSGQDDPPQGAITSTFAAGGGTLVFRNSGLPNGEAGFCQDSDGRVYITFTNGPPGCLEVKLATYDATQCQNGKLIGVDDISSTSIVASSEAVESKATSFETTPTAVVTSSSEDSEVPTRNAATESISTYLETADVPLSSTVTSSEQQSNTEPEGLSTHPASTSTLPLSSDESFSTESATEEDGSTTIVDESTSFSFGLTTLEPEPETPTSDESTTEPVETTETAEMTTDLLETTELVVTTTELAETTTDPADTTTVDACVSVVTDPAGDPPLDDRREQCSDLNVVTVSPSTVTETVTMDKRFVWVVPTSWPPTPPKKNRFAREEGDATTIFPTEFPEGYGAFCDDADDYYDACSRLGVTRTTTTLPTPTTTEEDPPCFAKKLVKRAGEAMGYEFEEHWELMTMPGYTMVAI
ncbi:hypothetical protein FLONG3_3065 [Fusarium longipes]|uniref:DUF7908 domain-containing protein n=1 Tax=Fusarium longipes TaxID=694270 RepID=A0A395T316_9HYPO|nr:hypothetical protein FLONG3_3065 [Fusarium longipes]